eukprot:CAMPEP_0198140262 /NCGR_PEP_ID=MMETSP1443-20131203/3454_1 /TAXON_ID=186043 /ORGANISM="Entomoneis sp., Strain CCMP2396" /LENGTH=235 /DNA_ID=CAMNT_0043802635 /DNA_START=164 /DNA_END=868 /DNA_ORIENTATION=+
MAKHLARIHGTEEDKVNCPFYFKIGACRHSDRCSRLHHKPAFSQTLLFQHMYKSPTPGTMSPEEQMEDFLCFYEEWYMELSKFGRLEGLFIADNVGDHMIGHTYAKFRDEEEATDCLQVMHGRYYSGRLILAEYSPVTDFREARCRDFDEDNCQRGGYCNFLHVKPVPFPLMQSLDEDSELDRRAETARKESEERSSSRKKRRREDRGDRERDSHHHHGHHRSRSNERPPRDYDD